MGAIFRRELSSYFKSPIAYIYFVIFNFFSGLFLTMSSLSYQTTDMMGIFQNMFMILVFLVPILTMKTFSEEKRQKTDQCLLTAPVSLPGIVLGKFLATYTVYAASMLTFIIYALVISIFSPVSWSVVLGSVLGLLLLGAVFISAGIFVSSLTENQIVAAIGSFILVMLMYLLEMFSQTVNNTFIQGFINKISFYSKFTEFSSGILRLYNVFYFVSVAVLFLYLTMKMLERKRWELKSSSISAAITAFVLAVIVLSNAVVSSLDSRFSLKADLTENKVYSISDMTKEYIGSLDKEIKITVLSTEAALESSATYNKQIVETVNAYTRLSDKISVRYMDPDSNPEAISQFRQIYTGELKDKLLVIQCGDKIKACTFENLIDYDYYSGSLSSKAEQAITSAISYVTQTNSVKIAVMSGSQADDLSQFITALSDSGYETVTIDPLTDEIPADASAVLVPCPQNDYTESTTKKIADFLDNGGNLGKSMIYIASDRQNAAPNLESLVAEYGMQLGDGYVMDTDTSNVVSLGGSYYALVTYPSGENYTSGMQNSSLPVLVPYSRPIEILDLPNRTVDVLLSTPETSIIIPNEANENLDVYSLPQSSQTAMAVGKKTSAGGSSSSVLVIGSSLMLDGGLISYPQYNNGEYSISAINTITGKESNIAIVSKDMTSATLNITLAQATVFKNIAMFLVPLIILIAGVIVWYRRRTR